MSSTDLLSKFDDLVKRFREEFKEMVEGERAKMKAEIEAYQAEKQRMKVVDVNDDDIILLNVGEQKFTSTRSTLCQVEGSLLATMFSGRCEDSVKRDEDGAVFRSSTSTHSILVIFWIICARRKSPLLRIQHHYRKSPKIKRKISVILSNISA